MFLICNSLISGISYGMRTILGKARRWLCANRHPEKGNNSEIIKMYKILTLTISVCFFLSCSSTTQYIRYQNGTIVKYELPLRWKVINVEPPSDHFNIIEPNESIDSNPGITIDYVANTDSKFPKTQEGYAKLYLSEIHNVKDADVKMDMLKTIRSPIYGNITIYRFFSDYYGDHLVAVVLNHTGYCVIELWRTVSDRQNIYQSEFEDVVRSIIIKHK